MNSQDAVSYYAWENKRFNTWYFSKTDDIKLPSDSILRYQIQAIESNGYISSLNENEPVINDIVYTVKGKKIQILNILKEY